MKETTHQPVTDVICIVYKKDDFKYHASDAEDTKQRLREMFSVWKRLCVDASEPTKKRL